MQCDHRGGVLGRSTARERLAPFPVSLGPWPMCGGKGDRRTRGKRSSSSQPGWRHLAVWAFPGRFLILTLKKGQEHLPEARARYSCLPSASISHIGGLTLPATHPPTRAGRGSGPAHQHKLWAGALCSWPSRADARVLECNAITGAGCWGGAQQESAWPLSQFH